MDDTPLVRIHAGGAFGKAIGRSEWRLRVSSPAEAIRAMDANTGGAVRRYLSGPGAKKLYKVAIGRKDNLLTPKEELHNRSGGGDIYILPSVKGGKAAGQIIAGIALIALAFVPGVNVAIAGFIGGGLTAGAVGGGLVMLGASMILGGVVQMLTPTPSFNQNSAGDSRGSNVFQGNAATVSQGGAVGLIYGRALVSPMPVSVSFTAFDQSPVGSTSYATQTYNVVKLPGGIVTYDPVDPNPHENLP